MAENDTLYIIDGHSQIYRAYYAPFRALTSPTGEPTRATYVFCSMMLKFFNEKQPRHIVMAADGPSEKLKRKAIYGEYKATRRPSPEDLPVQIGRIMQIVGLMDIPVLEAEGYEADDIIATLVEKFRGSRPIVLISRDKDLDQLLAPGVVMFDPMEDKIIDAAAVQAAKGYPPEKAVEVQTLAGDAIDNVPGVEGVGPKTAAKLVMQYGSVDGILAHADELTPKLRERVLAARDQLAIARQLVTLDRHMPLDVTLEGLTWPGLSGPKVRPIFAELGFNRLLDQLDQMGVGAAAQSGQASSSKAGAGQARPMDASPAGAGQVPSGGLFGDLVQPAQPAPEVSHAEIAAQAGRTTAADFDYHCIDTREALESLCRELATVKRLAVDTETTNVNPMWCQLVGISLAWKPGHAVYLPVKGPLGAQVLELDDVRLLLGPILADPKIEKVGQNLKYDMISLAVSHIELRGKLFDTMIAAHVLDSTRPSLKLDALAAEFLNHHGIPIEDLIGRGKKRITMDAVPCDIVTTYACEDADLSFRLAEVLEAKLREQNLLDLLEKLEMPLLPVLANMEMRGVAVDPRALDRMRVEISKQADVLRDKIIQVAGVIFNPDSPKQLADVMFKQLNLPVGRKTKTGPSTDSDVLETLAIDLAVSQPKGYELPALVLDYRKLQKLLGTYCQALVECINQRTHRIHTSFHQAGTATGRLSSSDPNLQNIPIRTEEGRRIRSAFVADEGYLLLSADYSQVEIRMLAHLCEDPTLMAGFAADEDIHRIVAAEVFGVKVEDVTPEMRGRAKTVNFGIIYGQTAFGLAASLRISRTDAGNFIAAYRKRFPRIEEFLQSCVAKARKDGYVETIFGRRRKITEIDSRNPQQRALAERLAINSVVQGSAADLIKEAMVNIDRRITEEKRNCRMLLQIHDELLFEVPAASGEPQQEMVVHEMTRAIQLRVPLKVEVGVGKNWMEAK